MDNILTLSLPPEDLATAVGTLVLATVISNKDYSHIYIVVNHEEKRDEVLTGVRSLLNWTDIAIENENNSRIKINDKSFIDIVVGFDYPPIGQTFTDVFLIDLDDETREKAMQYLAPILPSNKFVIINHWAY